MQVLIIEDHPVDRKLFRAVLRTGGYVVREELTGENALEALERDKPELVLMDLRLPKMNGLDLLAQIRSNPKYKDIPIIVMTAYPGQFTKRDMMAAGCDEYWVKPIDTRTLASRLAEVVDRRRKSSVAA